MATMNDESLFKEAMKEAKNHPYTCQWVEAIQITYSKELDKYLAQFDGDLNIIFDDVHYSSNSIYFMQTNGDDCQAIAFITHKGLIKKICED